MSTQRTTRGTETLQCSRMAWVVRARALAAAEADARVVPAVAAAVAAAERVLASAASAAEKTAAERVRDASVRSRSHSAQRAEEDGAATAAEADDFDEEGDKEGDEDGGGRGEGEGGSSNRPLVVHGSSRSAWRESAPEAEVGLPSWKRRTVAARGANE